MNDTDYLPAEIYNTRHQLSKDRQGLSELLDTRVPADRSVSVGQSQRISYVGGEIFKVRRPDIGETGLSEAEIDHAMTYWVSA